MRHAGGHTDVTAIQSVIQTQVQAGTLIQEAPHYRSTQDMKAAPMTRDSSTRYEAIAQAYVRLPADQQASTIVATGTNASRQAINARIHALRGLKGTGQRCQLLSRHDTTRAERSVARYYTVGDIVVSERDYQCGPKRGELYRVTGIPRHDRIMNQNCSQATKCASPATMPSMTWSTASWHGLSPSRPAPSPSKLATEVSPCPPPAPLVSPRR
ncbi:hypothetical protein [Castellaniella sp.]|uniref:hypothetical protein n=1 Tax=Castellaniella sp. TaxID=1955812 RepID=UPI002AFE06B7|nr:hypothetical protein [Castellaniella sp.]